jgi:nucleoside-diphosphate-sugar epimerase
VDFVRRIAVTGATGFIGRNLVADLVARGDDVRAIVRRSVARPQERPVLHPDATVVRTPLERAALAEAFAGVDAVVHLAGVVSAVDERDFFAVNVDLTRAVADAARAAGVRLIHISSLAAAGPAPLSAPRSEDDPPAPVTAYGRSKLEGERVVTAMPDLRWTILRPGIVYGPGDRAVLPLFRFARLGILPLAGRPGAAYMMIHVADLIRTIVAAVERTIERDTIFAGHPRPVSARELLEAVRAAHGGAARIVPVPTAVLKIAAAAGDIGAAMLGRPLLINRSRYVELSAEGFVCRVDRLRDRLGIVAQVELREGLAGTAAWYRRQGWL